MASQGPLGAASAANDSAIGTVAWSGTANSVGSNNAYGTCSLTTGNTVGNYLKHTGYGFSIPTGATIDGIVVEWEANSNTTTKATWSTVRSIKGGVIGGNNNGTGADLPATDAYVSFGGSADLWGQTWTRTDINAATFGFAFSPGRTGAPTATARIDDSRATVYYTTGDRTATGSPTLGHLTCAGVGAFVSPRTATGSPSTGPLTAVGVGLYLPKRTGTGTPTFGALSVVGVGDFNAPVYAGSGAVQFGPLVGVAAGEFVGPAFVGTGGLLFAPVTVSGIGDSQDESPDVIVRVVFRQRDEGRVFEQADTGRVFAQNDQDRTFSADDEGRVFAARDTGRVFQQRGN